MRIGPFLTRSCRFEMTCLVKICKQDVVLLGNFACWYLDGVVVEVSLSFYFFFNKKKKLLLIQNKEITKLAYQTKCFGRESPVFSIPLHIVV